MRRLAALCSLLLALPLRAEDDRFYSLASDYLEALQSCYWASQVNVDGRRPLVPLVLALDEQSRKLSEARALLLKHQNEPRVPARTAIAGLLSGVELLSLACQADEADINGMNDRWELSQRLESRHDDRRQALEVMAASVILFQEALYKDGPAGRKGVRALRLTPEEAGSLWKQVNFLFGRDIAGAGSGVTPLLTAVDGLRKMLHAAAPAAENNP
jgi:hypothetical protein